MSLYDEFLVSHGLTRKVSEVLYCDHFDIELFKSLLASPITLMCDYDCDGLNAGLIGYSTLKILGYDVNLYYNDPSIYDNGKYTYGLNQTNVSDMLSKYPNTKTIITADEGIGADLSFLNGQYNIIITDHHLGDVSDSVSTTFDPMVLDNFKFKGICGSTVIYQLVYQLATWMGVPEAVLSDIACFEVFAGIATLGDSMPLTDFNVGLVRRSVNRLVGIMSGFTYSDNPIITNVYKALYDILSKFNDKLHVGSGYLRSFLTAEFISFYYVPLINTIKRLNKPCKLFYDAFLNNLSSEIFFKFNDERKAFVEKVLSEIDTSPNPLNRLPFIYLIDEDKYSVAGLIANKLMESTGFPTVVLDKTTMHGSGRSFSYFPLLSLLNANGFKAGGHEFAFGIGVKNLAELDKLYNLLSSEFVQQNDLSYFKRLSLSSESVVLDIVDFYTRLKDLEPFGVGFKKPMIALDVDFSECDIRILHDKHIKLSYPKGDNPLIDIMIFNYPDHHQLQGWTDFFDCECSVVGYLAPNYFNKKFTFTFIVNDLL